MRRYIYLILAMLAFAPALWGQRVNVKDVTFTQSGNYLVTDMDVLLSQLDDVRTNEVVVLTPYIIKEDEGRQMELPSVAVYGRTRYYHYLRNNGDMMITGPEEITVRASKDMEVVDYRHAVAYEDWMDNATLLVKEQTYGCCGDILGDNDRTLARNTVLRFAPKFAYVKPAAEVKNRALSGSAFVDFRVNKTNIDPNYRNNVPELGKIQASIDSIKNTSDVEVKKIFIKGFASPEGGYANNERLAKGRTEALKNYVQGLYDFPASTYETAYEPEDWDGLISYLEGSSLASKDDILDIIRNSGLDPDPMEWRIKSRHAGDYAFLLQNVYPGLRHSDYRIEYLIRDFTDINEIKQLVRTHPQKLSLQEFYLAAQEYEAGSDDFNYVFETAVRMYPQDEVANLNAAVSALNRGDLVGAEAYLPKAGNSPEAQYARALLPALKGNYSEALPLLRAVSAQVPEAADAAQQIEKVVRY